VFFPLQVSTDQQVLVNYHGHSIFKALDEAIAYAQAKSIPLVTREHPAESRGEEVRAYIERRRAEGSDIQISNRPVYELIRLAEEVVTINSTVGLEAILNEKAVHFLGNSLYAKVTHAQLASYLNNYLIKVDYHSGDGMTPYLAAQILARAEHENSQS
jgi:capsular polysaccharide export protein